MGIKPPAVLVKLAAGRSYVDTVRDLRTTSGLKPDDYGATVKAVKKTRERHVLLELTKGAESQAAAGRLTEAISAKLGGSVGAVTQLDQVVEIEVVDIDVAADRNEVLEALKAAVLGGPDDAATNSERQAIQVTQLWATRSGQQVATAKMFRAAASRMSRITVGWTMCRVRERQQPPPRCYRCHGFGHSSRHCSGPDLSASFRRCGTTGHVEKFCPAVEDRCVACERAGFGMCAARRTAQAETERGKNQAQC